MSIAFICLKSSLHFSPENIPSTEAGDFVVNTTRRFRVFWIQPAALCSLDAVIYSVEKSCINTFTSTVPVQTGNITMHEAPRSIIPIETLHRE